MSNSATTETPGAAAKPPLTRALSALPDAITCSVFLVLWVAPFAFGESGVRNGMLLMLVEFVLIHATAMMGSTVESRDGRAAKVRVLLGFGLLYALFIGAFAFAFREWWPVYAFLWLLLSKVQRLFGAVDNEEARWRRHSDWALTCMLYLGGVFATLFLPLPRLGISREIQPQLGLEGSGEWVDNPHIVIAFGALYFGALAWARWRDFRFPRGHLPNLKKPPAQ
jgi:hypothetical protein